MSSFHDPVPDRLLGPLSRPVLGRVPPQALTLLSLAAAAAAFAAFVAESRVLGGVLVLVAALLDAGAVTPTVAPPHSSAGGATAAVRDGEGEQRDTEPDQPRPLPSDGTGRGAPEVGGVPSPEAASQAGGRGTSPSHALALALDIVVDRYADTLIFAGMAVWAQRQDAGPVPLAVGFAAAAGALGFGYGTVRTWASAGHEPAAALFGWLGRDLRLLVAAAGALTGLVYPALALLAVAGNLPVFIALARLPAYLREDASTPP